MDVQLSHLHRRSVALDVGTEIHRLRRNAQHQGAEHPIVPLRQVGLYASGVGRGELTVSVLDDLTVEAVWEPGVESGQLEYAGVHVAPPLTETMGRDPKVLAICHFEGLLVLT